MEPFNVFLIIIISVFAIFVAITLIRSVRVVPQQRKDVVERLGRYQRTLNPGLNLLVPFLDQVRAKVDMREQVVSFPPQPVITSDNLVVSIDTVLYFRVVDPVLATYEIANFLQAIEQLTVTTLRNVIGSMDLEKALTSRDEINRHLSGVLDETTGRWGIKVARVEIKAIEPPASIRDSMEKQMRAERDRRAAILNAEGVKQSQILTAEGDKQSAVLRADGDRQARILQAEGQAKAIRTVFEAVHAADPDPKVLAYQYLQALPQIAAGQANKVWIVPAELTRALQGIGGALGGMVGEHTAGDEGREPDSAALAEVQAERERAVAAAEAAVAQAQADAEESPRGLTMGEPLAASGLLGDNAANRAMEQARAARADAGGSDRPTAPNGTGGQPPATPPAPESGAV